MDVEICGNMLYNEKKKLGARFMIDKDTKADANKNMIETGAEAGMKKAGEAAFSRVVNGIIDAIANIYGDARVRLGNPFVLYLQNATERYNQVKTLATGNSSRTIIGPDSIYVSVGLRYEDKTIGTETIDPLLRINKHILIEGTGGIGKTMLMRYLFLNTAHRGEYVPVLLDLRKISRLPVGNLSIPELIYTCLKDFNIDLPKEQFEYSLQLGKYCFLMDGFDEIVESLSGEAAEVIQMFCSKYPKNPCIITSRHRDATRHLETFAQLQSCPLSKAQAVSLASKLWKEDEKTRVFCKQLEEHLFDEHKDFAENPLLLSMMFLTFMRNNSVPNHLAEFYESAYDALYNNHDSHNKGGYYVREFHCKNIDGSCFKKILMHFCFHSYFREVYEFQKDKILDYINKAIQKFNFRDVSAEEYLKDLQDVVCLIVEEGGTYRFSHRSFQTYFAASYTNTLSDEEQKRFIKRYYDKEKEGALLTLIWRFPSVYFSVLWQLNPRRFALNVLEEPLRQFCAEVNIHPDPDLCFIKKVISGVGISTVVDNREIEDRILVTSDEFALFSMVSFFVKFIKPIPVTVSCHSFKCLQNREWAVSANKKKTGIIISFSEIDELTTITEEERKKFYRALIEDFNIRALRIAMDEWLNDIEAQRQQESEDSFFENL